VINKGNSNTLPHTRGIYMVGHDTTLISLCNGDGCICWICTWKHAL